MIFNRLSIFTTFLHVVKSSWWCVQDPKCNHVCCYIFFSERTSDVEFGWNKNLVYCAGFDGRDAPVWNNCKFGSCLILKDIREAIKTCKIGGQIHESGISTTASSAAPDKHLSFKFLGRQSNSPQGNGSRHHSVLTLFLFSRKNATTVNIQTWFFFFFLLWKAEDSSFSLLACYFWHM